MIRVIVKCRNRYRELVIFKKRISIREMLRELGLDYDQVLVIVNGSLATPDEVVYGDSKVEILVVYGCEM